MKRTIIILIAVALLLGTQMVFAAEESEYTYDWLDYISFNSLQLLDTNLSLPENGFKDFSVAGQEELRDMATKFGDINVKKETIEIDGEEREIEIAELRPLPGIELNADYGQLEEDREIEKWTNINLNYKINNNTSIHAGYGLESKESFEIFPLNNDAGTEPEDKLPYDDSSRLLYSKEESKKKLLGISYQSSENLIFSADYVEEDIEPENSENSTIFGVEYIDEIGQLKASYQIDEGGEGKGTITGIELALPDIATLSASYQLLDPLRVENRLNKETVWDFGIDVNLTDFSSLSVGYQLRKNKEEAEILDKDKEESKFQASFTIDF